MTKFVSNDWRDRCLDCDVCVYSINEYYMVNDDVWAEAGMKQPDYSGQLCISCLEVRLNRELRSYDFSDFPINKGESQRASATSALSVMCQNFSMHDLMDLSTQKSLRAKLLVFKREFERIRDAYPSRRCI